MKIMILSGFTTSLFWFRLDMMKTFVSLGYDVIAVGDSSEEEWSEKFLVEGIRYKKISVSRNGTNPFDDLKTLVDIIKLLKEEKPDKIFAYQAKTVVYCGIATRILKKSEFYPLIAGIGSIFLGKGLKNQIIKGILTIEYRLAMKKAAKCFFQNDDDVNDFILRKIVNEKQIVMLNGSGVNLEKFKPSSFPDVPTFLCISRLIKDKGVYEYLEACRKLKVHYPYIRCMLVGPFDTNPSSISPEKLQRYINDGTIEYFGEQEDVYQYISMCSVYVLPSYREGTPKTVLEAMASGRAVITTDAPGCRETVVNNENGFLVPIKDVEQLVLTMKIFIENPSKAEHMGMKGRRIAESKYDVNLVNKVIQNAMKL